MTSGRPLPAVSAAVVVHAGRVLMVRRRTGEGHLLWQFPAGEVEPDETAAEAAVRETAEETALTVEELRDLGGRVHPATGRRLRYTACRVVSGTAYVADADELAELAWCDREGVRARVPYGLHAPVQAYLDETLSPRGT